uniref:hypothetical protein n=1 Tax=Burkholderia arboris TaxID=488730 RepID=UPI003BEF05F6
MADIKIKYNIGTYCPTQVTIIKNDATRIRLIIGLSLIIMTDLVGGGEFPDWTATMAIKVVRRFFDRITRRRWR